ncbi:ABC transporter substrate-binding protein [Tomitella biformata]|uniref:ABC transporter substrate-binding protein n=1 Tax=Tomitella biformata TaxID=630403 RepID=UPI000466E28A|nr:ABC transporter substrate-binding protein [Tomitella biformata]
MLPPPVMDPHATASIVGAFPYLSLVYDRLVRVDTTRADGQAFSPMVAESWEFSDGGMVLTFHLRDDAKFHDGAPVDAAAVKWSLERAKTKANSTVAMELDGIDRVEAPDANTVVLHLTAPRSDVLYWLSTLAGAIVNPAASDGDLSLATAGSGPYELESLKVGDRASFTRYGGYWDEDAQNMAKIEIVGIVDDQARMNALQSGQLDAGITKVTQYTEAVKLQERNGFGLTDTDRSAWYAMYMNIGHPALADVRVRQAMNLAIDRQSISDALLNGQCDPTSQPLQEGVMGHDPDSADRYGYDIDAAKRLLREAGYENGFELNVLTLAGVRTSDGVAVAIKDQLAKVGIELNLQQRDLSQAVVQWRAGDADGFQYTHPALADPGATMEDIYTGWLYPTKLPTDIAEVFAKPLDSNLGPAQREAALTAASRSASENAVELFVCAIPTQYAYNQNVTGLDRMSPPTSGGAFDLRNVAVTGGQ